VVLICKARITLDENNLLASTPPQLSHSSQEAEIFVLQCENEVEERAAATDVKTQTIVADSMAKLDFECMEKLNCHPNAIGKMARLSRRKANGCPPAPTSLETLDIPDHFCVNHQGHSMLIWDSRWHPIRRCSISFGSEDNLAFLGRTPH
jgi:hypothetical protein